MTTENKKRLTLAQLCDRYCELAETVIDVTDNVREMELEQMPLELEEAINDLLGDRNMAKELYYQKVNSILSLIKNRESWIEIRKNRVKELQNLVRVDENLVRNLNLYLLKHFLATNTTKLRTTDYNVSVTLNGGKQPLIVDEDVDFESIAKDLLETKTKTSLNKEKVRDRLDAGIDLPFARLGQRKKHLRIK